MKYLLLFIRDAWRTYRGKPPPWVRTVSEMVDEEVLLPSTDATLPDDVARRYVAEQRLRLALQRAERETRGWDAVVRRGAA